MEINHVGYSYHTMQGETPALSNINFTVHKGDFLAIVGPSGCGNAMVEQRKQIFPNLITYVSSIREHENNADSMSIFSILIII